MPHRCTIAEWMEGGPVLVKSGVDAVEITDRQPDVFKDRISPEGAFGWQYGWRWLDPGEPATSWTLPEEVFRCLPECPYPEAQGRYEPRWPTPDEAIGALSLAAFAWASRPDAVPRKRFVPILHQTDPS